jgi:tetratricopeptide (TPR) repeat protein
MMGKTEGVMRGFPRIFILVLSLCAVARAQSFDVRESGSHTLPGNDSANTARRLASLDAVGKALASVKTSLVGSASVNARGLTDDKLTGTDRAVVIAKLEVRLNPNHYSAHYNLGEMLRLAGNLEESAKEFREYVNRAPDNPHTQRNKERARSFIKAFEEP